MDCKFTAGGMIITDSKLGATDRGKRSGVMLWTFSVRKGIKRDRYKP